MTSVATKQQQQPIRSTIPAGQTALVAVPYPAGAGAGHRVDPGRPGDHGVGQWLAELERRPGVTRLRLGRLADREIAEIVTDLLSAAAGSGLLVLNGAVLAFAVLAEGAA
jgi:hypothetical protein